MAGLAAAFQDGFDRFPKGPKIRLRNALTGERDCGAGLQESGIDAAQVAGLLQGRWIGSILGGQHRAGAGDDQQDGKSQSTHEAPFLVSQRQSEACPMIHGAVEGREKWDRLLNAKWFGRGGRDLVPSFVRLLS